MPIHKIGRVGIVFYGEWEAERVYSYLDYVREGGDVYMCVAEHLSDELNKPQNGEDSTFWRVLINNSEAKESLAETIEAQIQSAKTDLQAQIDELISNKFKYVIVEELPSVGESGVVYFVRNETSADENQFDEFVYINDEFELIGSRAMVVDFSQFYTKGETELLLGDINSKLTALENRTDNDTIYDDSEIIARIETLEAKTDNDTIYDDTAIIARLEVLEAKTNNDTIYNDSEIQSRLASCEYNYSELEREIYTRASQTDFNNLKSRVETVENRTDNDTIYDDSELRAQISALIARVEALEGGNGFVLSDEVKNQIVEKIAVVKTSTANFKYIDFDNKTLYKHPSAYWDDSGRLNMSPADDIGAYQEIYYRLNKNVEVAQDKAGASVGTFYYNNLRFGFLDEDGNALGTMDEWIVISAREGVEVRGWVWLFENGVPKQKVAPFYFSVDGNS